VAFLKKLFVFFRPLFDLLITMGGGWGGVGELFDTTKLQARPFFKTALEAAACHTYFLIL